MFLSQKITLARFACLCFTLPVVSVSVQYQWRCLQRGLFLTLFCLYWSCRLLQLHTVSLSMIIIMNSNGTKISALIPLCLFPLGKRNVSVQKQTGFHMVFTWGWLEQEAKLVSQSQIVQSVMQGCQYVLSHLLPVCNL